MRVNRSGARKGSRLSVSATYHYTTTVDTSANVNFTSSFLAIYGAVGPDAVNYTVSIDSSTQTFTNTQNATTGRTLLYSNSSLGNTHHQAVITNYGSGLLLDLFVFTAELGAPG